ncbi:hypothetical protein ACP275_06G161400 [Erythranthe tilingii]
MGRKRCYYLYGDAITKIDKMSILFNKLEEVEVNNKLELELEEEVNNTEQKKNIKLELANLIYDIREQLEIIAAEKKRINRRLFIKAVDRRKRLVYDRDSTSGELRNCKKARFLNKSAKIALGHYRRTNLPHNEWSVVDVIRATESPCRGGYILCSTFTATFNSEEQEVKTFETMIYFGIDRTEVRSVRIVTGYSSSEHSSSSEEEDC